MARLPVALLAQLRGKTTPRGRADKGRPIPEGGAPAPDGVVARGRLAPRRMNKTEAAYAEHLERLRQAGEIRWWAFEAIKLRLADGTYFTPDFAVLTRDAELEMHDTKGHMEDDAAVKLKVARALFPMRFALVREVKGGGWVTRYVEGRIRA